MRGEINGVTIGGASGVTGNCVGYFIKNSAKNVNNTVTCDTGSVEVYDGGCV